MEKSSLDFQLNVPFLLHRWQKVIQGSNGEYLSSVSHIFSLYFVCTARTQTLLSICMYVPFVNNKKCSPWCSISPAHTLTTSAQQPPHLQLQPFLFLITVSLTLSLSWRGRCRRSELKGAKEHRRYSQKYLKEAHIRTLLYWQGKAVLCLCRGYFHRWATEWLYF